jgi:hypothetical protein
MPTTTTNLYFPLVQDTTQGGSWMIITAMAPGSAATVGSVALFIPGASSGSNLIFGSRHEYSETKLTKVIADAALSPIGIGFNAVNGLLATQGASINPKVEVLYRDTDLRTFEFSFIMSPANQAESQTIINIITLLRQYAAPTLIVPGGGYSDPRQGYISNQSGYLGLSSGGMFKTPNEFIIDFMMPDIKGNLIPNDAIPKIGRCVIEGIEVMYNPNGEWSTFADGSPVSTQLRIAFREMRVIDSKNINQGY